MGNQLIFPVEIDDMSLIEIISHPYSDDSALNELSSPDCFSLKNNWGQDHTEGLFTFTCLGLLKEETFAPRATTFLVPQVFTPSDLISCQSPLEQE